jgi:uncharacterized protein Yka (UPF0111/DUF47 family)
MLLLGEHKVGSETLVIAYKRLHELESEGDRVHRRALAELMGARADTLDDGAIVALLKWKEIFQLLEDTLDCCEDVAILFEHLRIKYH